MAPSKKKTRASGEQAAPSIPAGSKSRSALNPLEAASPALAGPPPPTKAVPFLDGVRVIAGKETGVDLEGSDVTLCGYLGLAGTKELRELYNRLRDLLERLESIIKVGYHKEATGKGLLKTQIEVSKLFGYISGRNDIDISDFDPKSGAWPLPTEGNTFHGTYRPFLYWMKTLYDILNSGQGVDISTKAPEGDPAARDPKHAYWGFASEDWHRAYFFVKNWLKKTAKKTSRQVRYYATADAGPSTAAAGPSASHSQSPATKYPKPVEFDWIEDPEQV
ncbi:MAG: hypothetical protein Q9176_008105 [Flavoplaca citrina]